MEQIGQYIVIVIAIAFIVGLIIAARLSVKGRDEATTANDPARTDKRDAA
jgi:hypothetical protein